MGFALATELVAGAFLGWLVDQLAGTSPAGLLIGAIAGLVVGMTTFIRSALKASAEASRRVEEERDEASGRRSSDGG